MQNRNPIEVNVLIVTIAQEGDFNWAAERILVTPPTLTRRATSPDRNIGEKLFVRSTRNVALTAAFAQRIDVTVYDLACRKNDRNRL